MSAVLQHEMEYADHFKTIRMEVPSVPFDDIYRENASCVIMTAHMHQPHLQDRVELVEVSESQVVQLHGPSFEAAFSRTGREVSGHITAVHSYGPNLIVSFRATGRTFPVRDECRANPEANCAGRHFFGLGA